MKMKKEYTNTCTNEKPVELNKEKLEEAIELLKEADLEMKKERLRRHPLAQWHLNKPYYFKPIILSIYE